MLNSSNLIGSKSYKIINLLNTDTINLMKTIKLKKFNTDEYIILIEYLRTLHCTKFHFIILKQVSRADITVIPMIFNLCHLFFNKPDLKFAIKDIIDDHLTLFKAYISTNQCDKKFKALAGESTTEVSRNINNEMMGMEYLKSAQCDIRTFIYNLPHRINTLGYKNLQKFMKMESKEELKEELTKYANREIPDFIHIFKLGLGMNLDKYLSYHHSDFIRIEYFRQIENAADIVDFVRINQFIDSAGLRKSYIKYFKQHVKRLDVSYRIELREIAIKMCKSIVKIRREVGLNFCICLHTACVAIDKNVFKALSFDSYEEIRVLARNFCTIKFSRNFLLKKLQSHEYYNIYGGSYFIIRDNDVEFYIKLFKQLINNSSMRKPLYGFIVLINESEYCLDLEINFIYNYLFEEIRNNTNWIIKSKRDHNNKSFEHSQSIIDCNAAKKSGFLSKEDLDKNNELKLVNNEFIDIKEKINSSQFDNINTNQNNFIDNNPIRQSIRGMIYWRTMKEISMYYCHRINVPDDIFKIVDIMFYINHFGVYSKLYEGLKKIFKNFESRHRSDITNVIDKLIIMVDDIKQCNVRKGAGAVLLFHSLFFINEKNTFLYFINRIRKSQMKILYLNVLALYKTDDIESLYLMMEYGFGCYNETLTWDLKNAIMLLFTNLIKILFGRNAWNREYQKNICFRIRDIIYEYRFKAVFLILCFYDRINELNNKEIAFVESISKKGGLYYLKCKKILERKFSVNPKFSVLENDQKVDYNFQGKNAVQNTLNSNNLINLYTKCNSEDKSIREGACYKAHEYGFELVSCEYLKYLLAAHAVKNGYSEKLKESLKNHKKGSSRVGCFKPENDNIYYDFEHNLQIIQSMMKNKDVN